MVWEYYYAAGYGTASESTAAATYSDGVLGLSPVGYWPTDDASGNFADATGNGWTATANGDPTYQQTGPTVNGEALSAIAFDGTGDYATVASGIDDSVSGQMTIAFWFKVAPTAAAQNMVCMSDTGAYSWRAFLATAGEGAYYAYQDDGASIYGATQPGGALDDDAWHLLIGWIDSNGYVNLDIDNGTITSQDTTLAGTWNGATTSGLAFAAFNTSGSSAATVSLSNIAYWDSDIGASARSSLYTGVF